MKMMKRILPEVEEFKGRERKEMRNQTRLDGGALKSNWVK